MQLISYGDWVVGLGAGPRVNPETKGRCTSGAAQLPPMRGPGLVLSHSSILWKHPHRGILSTLYWLDRGWWRTLRYLVVAIGAAVAFLVLRLAHFICC